MTTRQHLHLRLAIFGLEFRIKPTATGRLVPDSPSHDDRRILFPDAMPDHFQLARGLNQTDIFVLIRSGDSDTKRGVVCHIQGVSALLDVVLRRGREQSMARSKRPVGRSGAKPTRSAVAAKKQSIGKFVPKFSTNFFRLTAASASPIRDWCRIHQQFLNELRHEGKACRQFDW